MATKDYMGCCGACVDCDLSSGDTRCYSTTFQCTRYNRSVKADERACSRFEPAKNRSNEIIAKYDR